MHAQLQWRKMIFLLFCLGAVAVAHVNGQEGHGRRVIYGVEVQDDDKFPFMALVYYGDEEYCGAMLIHVRWALTAGHCIQTDKSDPKIMVGTLNKVGGTYYHAHVLIRHEGFVALSEEENLGVEYVINDIGLIRTDYDIQLNYKNIAPISLATNVESYDNEIGFIVGWGKIGWLDPSFPDKLLYGKVKIMSKSECQAFYPYVGDNHICTAVDGLQSICNGDSGGPLILRGLAIGIASTADYECRIGDASVRPNLFTKITSYLSWIKDQLAAYNDELL